MIVRFARRVAACMPCLLLAAVPIAVPTSGAADRDQGEAFLTNLALLDALTREAVDQVLDSLDVNQGEEILVLPSGSNEGNEFVADAFARALARRGCAVRLLQEPAPTAPAGSPAGGGAGDLARSLGNAGQEGAGEAGGAGEEAGETTGAGGADTTGAGGEEGFDDFFGEDSVAVNPDSTEWSPFDADSLEAGEEKDDEPGEPGSEGEKAGADSLAPRPIEVTPPAVARGYPEGPILEFRVLEFGIQYPSIQRRFLFFGNASVRRLGGVYLQASRIQGPRGQVLDVASGQSHLEDRLSGRHRAIAEGASFPFQKPTVPPVRIGRVIEPVAVVGILASLVYLFYQNQN